MLNKLIINSKLLFLTWSLFSMNTAKLLEIPKLQLLKDIFEQLSECEVYHVTIKGNSKYSYALSQTSHFHASGTFTAKLNFEGKSLNGKSKSHLIPYQRFRDVHKHIKLCGVGLFFFESSQVVEKHLVLNLFSQFTPIYEPLIRKDEDYFIFFMNSEEQAESILLSKSFGSKIKFKIAVSFPSQHPKTSQNDVVLVQNVDLYGKEAATLKTSFKLKPNVKTISTEDSLLRNIFPDTTDNFQGKAFKMSIPKVDFRFEMAWDSEKEKYVPKRGYYKAWLDEAMTRFNFTYDLFPSSFGGGTGKVLSNGSWAGAVADILDGSADWAFVVGHIYSRHKFLEWSAPLSYEQMVFLTHQPKTFISPKAIFWSFTPFLWALFVATILLVPLVLKFVVKASRHSWTYGNMLEYVYATFLEQGHQGPYILPLNSLKVLGTFWLLFAMIVSVAYKGKLTALLAFPISSWVPTSFEELAYSHFHVGLNVVGKGGAAYSIFASSQSTIYKSLFERMELYPQADKCLLKATKEDLCCIMWQGVADYIIARNLSDRNGNIPLLPSTETTSFIADGLVWEKRAVFRKHLDKSIWSSIEGGLVPQWFQEDQRLLKHEKWKIDMMNEKVGGNQQIIEDNNNNGPKKLQLTHFKGVFSVLFGGAMIALLKFLEETNIFGEILQLLKCAGRLICKLNKFTT